MTSVPTPQGVSGKQYDRIKQHSDIMRPTCAAGALSILYMSIVARAPLRGAAVQRSLSLQVAQLGLLDSPQLLGPKACYNLTIPVPCVEGLQRVYDTNS